MLEHVLDAQAPRILVYGPPGTGKSLTPCLWAQAHRHEVLAVTLTEETPMTELRGHFILKGNTFVWHDGLIARAWPLSADEETRLLDLAPPFLRCLIIAALDTGTRRGEMLALTWADLDAKAGWIRLRGATTKSRKTRWVPVSTTRLQAVFDYLRLDADGQTKPAGAPVFSNEVGESIRYFQTAWEGLRRRAGVTDLRWHDLRHEYASRLVERGVPLSQVRDLLGHASIVTTERYDNQKPEALMAAAKRLDTGEIFKNLSSPGRT